MENVSKFKNAQAVIKQIEAGEWEFIWNEFSDSYLTAYRDKNKLWVGNGSFFCDVNESNAFGYIWRHWVYWSAVYPVLRKIKNRERRKKQTVKLY